MKSNWRWGIPSRHGRRRVAMWGGGGQGMDSEGSGQGESERATRRTNSVG